MIGRAQERDLQHLVDAATLARGRRYAASGAVLSREWDTRGDCLTGEVQGGAARPYQVVVDIRRTGTAAVEIVATRCTCPVGDRCKHAVALLLAPTPARQPQLRVVRDEVPPAPPSWAEPLAALLDGRDVSVSAAEPAAVGLQFELVSERAHPGQRRNVAARPGIRLRPVVRSPAHNWVRTGISWSRLEDLGSRRRTPSSVAEGVALLAELRALHRLVEPMSYLHGDDVVWLESISSRRLWDLLAQAEEGGVALVLSGPGSPPVHLARQAADAAIDLTRHGSGLRLRPQLLAGRDQVDVDRALWIGSPHHGVAWWQERASGAATPELHLASLSRSFRPEVFDLLQQEPIEVRTADVERFEAEVLPQLRRRVALRSTDGSVDLPDDLPDALVLGLAPHDGPSLELCWSLVGADGRERELGDDPDGTAARAASAAVEVLAGRPGLTVLVPGQEMLAPTARLEGMDAARFATEMLPDLEGIDGLEVRWSGPVPTFREATDAPTVRLGGEETPDGDWLDLLVEVEVGGEEVAFHALFLALAAGDSHLLLPSGTYFSLDHPELRQLAELIAEARSLHDPPPGRVRLSRFQASLWEELQAIGIVTAQAGAWSDAVAALASAGDDQGRRPLPAGLTATLRPYQETGFQWLASRWAHGLGGILADDMGLGKTLQALALICHARERRASDPWLVVAPTSVVGNWVAEAARFAPGVPTVAVTETERRRGTTLAEATAGAGIVVTSYTLFRLEHEAYEALGWEGLLLDEAQFAKNPASHNYQRARRLNAPFKLAMTGTPLENSLTELWALTSITAPGLFARPDRFAEDYRVPIERHQDAERLDQLRRRIRPVMLRRTKDQVAADLPVKQEQILELELHPRHRRLYQTWLQRERQRILSLLDDMNGNRFEIFRSLTLLRQAALDVSLVDPAQAGVPSTKLDALDEMLADVVADGHRVLVFSQFTRFLTQARRRAEGAGIDCCYLDGRMTKRAAVIDGFRTGRAPVFFISLKAGGFGLNLTEAEYCILLDPWWNPATEAQAVDRVHRIGQTRKVMVYRLVAKDTIEAKVMALKAKKVALFDSVVGGGGFESGAISAADIRTLLS
jgi:superfamily II DNA or RNA helicase